MKRCSIFLILSAFALLSLPSCQKETGDEFASVQVELTSAITAPNAAGDLPFDFLKAGYAGFATNAGDRDSVLLSGNAALSGKCKVKSAATQMWCYSAGSTGDVQTFSVPSVSSGLENMVYCSETISLNGKGPYSSTVTPLTSGIVLELLDSKGSWSGKGVSSVVIRSDYGKPLAGDITLCLKESRVGELKHSSDSISFAFAEGSVKIGTASAPASLSAAILPCSFTGAINLVGEGFTATLSIKQPLYLQAGYVKHIQVDMAMADVEAEVTKHFPYRVGIMGDSISTFEGIIPSDHRPYYTNPPASGCDVDSWQKTYWGQLITNYWHCELDVNTSWSGSSVADGKEGSVRTPFVDHSRLDLFKNPDVIILFGGTNDASASNGIGLGEFNYDTPLDKMNTTKRFRDAYIYVIRYLQEKHPGVIIICIIGTHVTGEYGNSVETIAKHFGLPYVDFRGDTKVTIYSGSHPNAAGHAHKAQRIYEETLSLFQ